jgi:hypothetical protein
MYQKNNNVTKIAYLLSHPIPYQSAFAKYLNTNKNIDLHVYYSSKSTLKEYYDKELKKNITWDTELLNGYKYFFLKTLFDFGVPNLFLPLNYGLIYSLYKNKIKHLMVHGHARPYNILIIILAKIFGIKVYLRSESTDHAAKRKFLSAIVIFFIDKCIEHYFSIGDLNRDYYLNRGVDKTKISHLGYNINNDFFYNFRLQKKSKDLFYKKYDLNNKIKFLYLSKLTKRKNILFLIKNYIYLISKNKKFKDSTNLIIVGDGELKIDVINLIKKFKKNIIFLGFQNQSQIPFYYKVSDFFILPSSKENWGLVVNEALSCGLPALVSDEVGSHHNLIRNCFNGMVFKNLDSNDFRKKMLKLSNMNIPQLSKNAKKSMLHHNFEQNIKSFTNIVIPN